LGRVDFLFDQFAALGLKAQLDGFAVERDVGFQQRCRTARAAQPRILFAAGPNSAARDEFDHRGEREFARWFAAAEMLADAALNARQRIREPSQPARLANFAHALPFGVITIL